jgi:hypothetical protein
MASYVLEWSSGARPSQGRDVGWLSGGRLAIAGDPPFRTMERREPRASRSSAWQPRRLAGWQLWELAHVASQARAAGDRAVKMHGVVIFFRHPEGTQQGCGRAAADIRCGR